MYNIIVYFKSLTYSRFSVLPSIIRSYGKKFVFPIYPNRTIFGTWYIDVNKLDSLFNNYNLIVELEFIIRLS